MLQGITHVQLGMEWENQKKPLLQYLYTVSCVTFTFGESTLQSKKITPCLIATPLLLHHFYRNSLENLCWIYLYILTLYSKRLVADKKETLTYKIQWQMDTLTIFFSLPLWTKNCNVNSNRCSLEVPLVTSKMITIRAVVFSYPDKIDTNITYH